MGVGERRRLGLGFEFLTILTHIMVKSIIFLLCFNRECFLKP